jgi:hypothetical protein
VGTRTGLRGQSSQCTLRELCNYLWAPTRPGDQRPDITRTTWGRFTMEIADTIFRQGHTVSERKVRLGYVHIGS